MSSSLQTTVVILCAGDGRRWGNYLGIPKQLAQLAGETLLQRAFRLAGEHGASAVFCIANDLRLRGRWELVAPLACRYTAETLLSTRDLWAERTIVLLGDVFYSQKALRRIFAFKENLRVFGRPWPSRYTGRDHGEIFAVSFNQAVQEKVSMSLRQALKAAEDGAWGNLWDFYHCLVGIPLNSGLVESRLFSVIDDLTDDCDTPEDYEILCRNYELFSSHSPGSWITAKGLIFLAAIERLLGVHRHPHRRRWREVWNGEAGKS